MKFCRDIWIYDVNWNINNSHYSKLSLSPLSQSRYQLSSSSNTVMHIISVNMPAVPHCQVGDKQEWRDNSDYITLEHHTRVCIYVLKANCDKT